MRFETSYDVMLPHPVEWVFRMLALPEHVERVLRLSPILTRFTLVGTEPGPAPETEVTTFEFTERVPAVPGVYSTDVSVRVEQTVTPAARRVDYRSRSLGGVPITVHKVRTFHPIDDASTRVAETIYGDTLPGLHLIARRSARQAHIAHMDLYAGLLAQV